MSQHHINHLYLFNTIIVVIDVYIATVCVTVAQKCHVRSKETPSVVLGAQTISIDI